MCKIACGTGDLGVFWQERSATGFFFLTSAKRDSELALPATVRQTNGASDWLLYIT